MIRPAPLLLSLLVCLSASAAPPSHEAKIADWLAQRLEKGGDEAFIVLFDGGATETAPALPPRGSARRRAVYDRLRTRAMTFQADVRRALDAAGVPYRPLYIVNGLALRGNLGLARALAARSEVVRIVGDPVVRGVQADLLATSQTTSASPLAVEWGIARINADDVWTVDGNRGEGITVASADTGVMWNHPALIGAYRGWNGAQASHDYNWYDPFDGQAVPFDDHSHGTHTTGTMIGDDGAGNQVGVAPGARWIACKNMDLGNGTPSSYMACNQFFLAPFPHGGDPEQDGDPSKSPDIVNNSWGCPPSEGCDPFSLEESFVALHDAGIFSIASAGNSGSTCSSIDDPPGIYAENFVVGATNSSDQLTSFSSRGPVTIDGSGRLRPDISAPGSIVRSASLGGGYHPSSGTSMAAPHVAGAAALLWSVRPELRGLVDLSRCHMTASAASGLTLTVTQSCGGTTVADRPNNMWGYGLLDAYGAIHLPDGDADGIANACDCASADPSAFAAPGACDGVRFEADGATIVFEPWGPAAGSGTVYDAVRGDLATLRATGVIDDADCVGAPWGSSTVVDAAVPEPGQGFYYALQARNACASGGFGATSDGAARLHDACP